MQLTDNKSGDIIIDTLEGNTQSDGAGSYIGGY